jgi:hypothetical protein
MRSNLASREPSTHEVSAKSKPISLGQNEFSFAQTNSTVSAVLATVAQLLQAFSHISKKRSRLLL